MGMLVPWPVDLTVGGTYSVAALYSIALSPAVAAGYGLGRIYQAGMTYDFCNEELCIERGSGKKHTKVGERTYSPAVGAPWP